MRLIQQTVAMAVLLFATACTHPHQSQPPAPTHLLHQAKKLVETDPREALQNLNQVVDPSLQSKDAYMHYIATRTQARYMLGEDITGDTLIFAAQQYFVQHNQPEMAARACFYAGSLCAEKETTDQALAYFLQAYYYAAKAGNQLFEAKSAYWIGNIYYKQDALPEAETYYLKALALYQKLPNEQIHQLGLMHMLGRTYREMNQLDQAQAYFEAGLSQAQAQQNSQYEGFFWHNLAIVSREKNELEQAKKQFKKALAGSLEPEALLQIYVDYAKLYRMAQQPDSVKHYLDQVHSRMAEITYPFTRRAVYRELADYYQTEGNHAQAMHYWKRATEEDIRIQVERSEVRLQKVAQEFEAFRLQARQNEARLWWFGLIGISFLLVVLGALLYRMQHLQRFFRRMRTRLLLQQFDQQKILTQSYEVATQGGEAVMREIRNKYPDASSQVVWESFEKQRIQINQLFSQWAKQELLGFKNGRKAIDSLTIEDLCLMYFCYLKYPGEKTLHMLGYPFYSEQYMASRKQFIRQQLANAGVSTRDCNRLVPF